MAAVMIDTAEFVEALEKEGIEHRQARAFVNVVRRSQEIVLVSQVKALEEASTRTAEKLDSKTEKALTTLKDKVDKRFTELGGVVDKKFTELESAFDKRISALKVEMDKRFAQADTKIDKLESKMDTRFAEIKGELTLLKWMLGVLITGVAGLLIRAFFMP